MKAISCIICRSTKKSVVRTKVRYGIKRKVFRCGTCGMVYLEPSRMQTFYSGKAYRKRYGPILGKASKARAVFELYSPHQRPIVDALRGVLRKDMKVLDVGCSAGQFLNALKGKVKERVGLELSADEVAFARKRLGLTVYDVPIEKAHIAEGPFDLVTCLQTLEHVEDPVGFLKHLGANLKKNGYLYLELPNIDDVLLTHYKCSGYADFYYREPHLSYFSKKTLQGTLARAGFRGRIGTIQRYNLLNHIHWVQSGVPQRAFHEGNKVPMLVLTEKDRAGRELNAFIKTADIRYRHLLERNGLGESLTFLGKKAG